MADRISPERRSWNMSRIRGRNTRPERTLRSLLHRAGLRFRLHDPKLPGKPDIVLPKYRTVVLVHGCYWHRHPGCPRTTTPKTNIDFWQSKFDATVRRDKEKAEALKVAGWKVLTVWECDLEKAPEAVSDRIRAELAGGRNGA